MLKVFIDSSVLIAALLSNSGGSAVILRQGRDKKITMIISDNVVGEVVEKLAKIKKSKEELREYLDLVSDPKDAHILAGAKLSHCDILVTLDKKHLLNLEIKNKFKPLKIVSPKEFLEGLF